MAGRILTWDELTDELKLQSLLNYQIAFGGFWDTAQIERTRRVYRDDGYHSLYVVEDDEVLAHVAAPRFPVTTSEGTEWMLGVSGVVTRSGAKRRGLMRELFEDMHQRERADGIRNAILWTNASWGAHPFYRTFDYIDAWETTSIIKRVPRDVKGLPLGWELQMATKADAPVLDDLHRRAHEGRCGFRRGLDRAGWSWFTKRFQSRISSPKDYVILRHADEPVAYCTLNKNPFRHLACELAATSVKARDMLLRGLERRARGRILTMHGSFPQEHSELLRRRGYYVADDSWFVLMAANLDGTIRKRDLVKHLGFDRRKIAIHCGDFF